MIGAIGTISTGIGAIGGIANKIGGLFGNNRSSKRQARQEYRDILTAHGVRPSLVDNWHSDEHSAGETLLQIASAEKGVEFLNQNMPSKITRSAVQSLVPVYQRWIQEKQKSGGSSGSVLGDGGFAPLLGLGGLIYWVLGK